MTFISKYIRLRLIAAALGLLVLLNGCYSGGGGCSVRNDLTEAPALPAAEDVPQLWASQVKKVGLGPYFYVVLHDTEHECDYVTVGKTLFCWRGTNLLLYTYSP